MNAMRQVMLEGSVALLLLSALGIASAWAWSRMMDRANDRQRHKSWSLIVRTIQSEPRATALYYGLRWLGICLLVGWLFSRAV